MPSIVETSWYFCMIASALGITTSTETLVNFPVLDCRVSITAPIRSNAFSTASTLSLSVGTINLYKYLEGQTLLTLFNSSFKRMYKFRRLLIHLLH